MQLVGKQKPDGIILKHSRFKKGSSFNKKIIWEKKTVIIGNSKDIKASLSFLKLL